MPLDADFLTLLACPACKGRLGQPAEDRLCCPACAKCYPVRDGIPVLLLDEAFPEGGRPRAPEAEAGPTTA